MVGKSIFVSRRNARQADDWSEFITKRSPVGAHNLSNSSRTQFIKTQVVHQGPSKAVYVVQLGEKASFCPVAEPSRPSKVVFWGWDEILKWSKTVFLNNTRNCTSNSNVCVHLRSTCALDHFSLSANVIRSKEFWLIFRTLPFPYSERHHASLAGNVFSTQNRLADETTYEHTRNLFFMVIRKSLYIN